MKPASEERKRKFFPIYRVMMGYPSDVTQEWVNGYEDAMGDFNETGTFDDPHCYSDAANRPDWLTGYEQATFDVIEEWTARNHTDYIPEKLDS